MLPRFSIAEWMRLAALVAVNLVFFRGVWQFVVVPPLAILSVVLNLVLYAVWVRRRSLTRAEAAAEFTGLWATVATFAYLSYGLTGPWKPRLAGQLLDALPEQVADRLPATLRGTAGLWHLEYALLIGLGLLAMVAAALLARALERRGGTRAAARRAPSP